MVVGQGGNVINLNVVSILGVDKDEMMPEYNLIADVQRNFPNIGEIAVDMESVFFYRCGLGNFVSREEAEKVLEDLLFAYESGAKVFRVPAKEKKL